MIRYCKIASPDLCWSFDRASLMISNTYIDRLELVELEAKYFVEHFHIFLNLYTILLSTYFTHTQLIDFCITFVFEFLHRFIAGVIADEFWVYISVPLIRLRHSYWLAAGPVKGSFSAGIIKITKMMFNK